MYKVEPEYHAIGDRVILLRTLETGYVIGIDDDHMIVAVGRKRKQHRVHFLDLYN